MHANSCHTHGYFQRIHEVLKRSQTGPEGVAHKMLHDKMLHDKMLHDKMLHHKMLHHKILSPEPICSNEAHLSCEFLFF